MRGSAEDKNLNTHYPNTVFLFPYPMLIFDLGGVFGIYRCMSTLMLNRRTTKEPTHTIDVEQRSKELTHIG